MDEMVKQTQEWLNAEYGPVGGWVTLKEDGNTGWDTIYGLRRGLQTELGISPVAAGFGPATTSAFVSQIGQIDAGTTSVNLLRLLSGALWCKGYYGRDFTSPIAFSDMADSVSTVARNLGLSTSAISIDVKLMASLLSMDAYTIPWGSDGTEEIRFAQQWLNGTYAKRANFALVPCDGFYSRQIQTALLYALQYEIGMDDATANGNFGPGTRAGLQTQASVALGDSDSTHNFVRLFKMALLFNGYDPSPDGVFDVATKTQVTTFQSFMELAKTGEGDYGTWCALLVSTGDPDRPVNGLDTTARLTFAEANAARATGYSHIGRYIVGADKFIAADELSALKAAGFTLFPIHQRFNNSDSEMTLENGRAHAIEALARCRTLGIPAGQTVFFAVDYDPTEVSIAGPVIDFFTGINEGMGEHLLGGYQIGVYGTRNVCQAVMDAGKASAAFVAGMSTGWSGNMGFRMPNPWSYNQIQETTESFGGVARPIDRVAVSRHATGVDLSTVIPPPVEQDGADTKGTGFNALYQWVVQAEAACERALQRETNPLVSLTLAANSIPQYILGWLRKPTYWDHGFLWRIYTPEPSYTQDPIGALARTACEGALDELEDIREQGKLGPIADIRHMAASTLSYLEWGVPQVTYEYGPGDLGGWLLDLLSLWGQHQAAFPTESLAPWLHMMIGKVGGGKWYLDDPSSKFDRADVLADADAWLLADAMQGDSSGLALSNALRSVYQYPSAERITRFYQQRFNGLALNLSLAFCAAMDGLDLWGLDNIPGSGSLLLRAANPGEVEEEDKQNVALSDVELPEADDATTLAHAYADFLANSAG